MNLNLEMVPIDSLLADEEQILDEGPWSSYTGSGSYWSGMLGCNVILGIDNNTVPFQLWQMVPHNL